MYGHPFGGYAPCYPNMGYGYPPAPPQAVKPAKEKPITLKRSRKYAEEWAKIHKEIADEFEKKQGGKKDDKDKKWNFTVWDTMLLLTIFAAPLGVIELVAAKVVLSALAFAVTK